MSDPQEPRTEAGKALVVTWGGDGGHTNIAAILAIEEQAAAEARRELLAKVEGLDTWPGVVREFPDKGRLGPPEHVIAVSRAAVLALLDPSR